MLKFKIIYCEFYPLCVMHRSEIEPEQPQKILEFHFEADSKTFSEMKGSGRHVEGNIWKAGSDPGFILLGVSFQATDEDNRVLLNTIHIAPPDEASQSMLANGLVIKTYPLEVE